MVNRNKLRGAIASAGVTQKELANKIGVSQNTLSNKISGKTYFDTYQIELICNILGISDNNEKAEIFLASSSQ